jgi:alpha-1,2-mannosyltransferase
VAELTPQRSFVVRAGSVLLSVALLVAVLTTKWRVLFDPSRTEPLVDIEYYRNALAAVAAGEPLFDLLGYPPFALVLIAPVGWFPLRQAEQIWTIAALVGAVLLAAVVVWLARRAPGRTVVLPGPDGAAVSVALAAVLLLSSDPMESQLHTGQISLFVIALAFVDGSGLLPRRLQGSLVGLAGAIKLTPMIFVPYYLVTGQRRQAVTAVASFLLFTGLGFALFPGDSVQFWTNLGSTTRFGDIARLDNLSMLGVLSRWIGDPTVARFSWYALFVVVGGIALLRARAHARRGEAVQATLVVGTASAALSPVAWPHHQIWLILIAIWLLWTPRVWERVLGAAIFALYSPVNSVFVAPAVPESSLAFAVALLALAPVAICLTGLPRDLASPP